MSATASYENTLYQEALRLRTRLARLSAEVAGVQEMGRTRPLTRDERERVAWLRQEGDRLEHLLQRSWALARSLQVQHAA